MDKKHNSIIASVICGILLISVLVFLISGCGEKAHSADGQIPYNTEKATSEFAQQDHIESETTDVMEQTEQESESGTAVIPENGTKNNPIRDLLIQYLFDGSTQSHTLFEFFDDGTGKEYFSMDRNSDIHSREQLELTDTFTYEIQEDQLIINGRLVLDFVKKTDCEYYYIDGEPIQDSFNLLPDIPNAFYQTTDWDHGGPSDQPAYLVPVLEKSSLNDNLPETIHNNGIDEEEAVELARQYFLDTYGNAIDPMAVVNGGIKTINGIECYEIHIKAWIDTHWSTHAYVYVAVDGSKIFE